MTSWHPVLSVVSPHGQILTRYSSSLLFWLLNPDEVTSVISLQRAFRWKEVWCRWVKRGDSLLPSQVSRQRKAKSTKNSKTSSLFELAANDLPPCKRKMSLEAPKPAPQTAQPLPAALRFSCFHNCHSFLWFGSKKHPSLLLSYQPPYSELMSPPLHLLSLWLTVLKALRNKNLLNQPD